MTAASNSEARKRAQEAAQDAQNAAGAPWSPPVDSGATGRLIEAERADLVAAIDCDYHGPEYGECGGCVDRNERVAEEVERILREHTDRALAEVEQRIEAEMWTGGAGPLSIVRAARQERGR